MGDGQGSRVGMGRGQHRAGDHRLCDGNNSDIPHRAAGAEEKNLTTKLFEDDSCEIVFLPDIRN